MSARSLNARLDALPNPHGDRIIVQRERAAGPPGVFDSTDEELAALRTASAGDVLVIRVVRVPTPRPR